MAPWCLAEGVSSAGLKGLLWLVWPYVHHHRSQFHHITALPTYAVLHTTDTRENLMSTCEEDGISFLPRCQRNGMQQSQWQFKGKLSKVKYVDKMGPSPSPDQPSHNWHFLLERLWFSLCGMKLLNSVFSEGRKTTWKMKWQIASFFAWVQTNGLKLLRSSIFSVSFHRAFTTNPHPPWEETAEAPENTLWYFEPKELKSSWIKHISPPFPSEIQNKFWTLHLLFGFWAFQLQEGNISKIT